jgi:glutamine amidotransferase
MCLLSYYPVNTQPVVGELENGAVLNSDGHGWAIVHESSIIVGKGFNASEVIGEFAAMRAKYPDGPALFHSRMATDGALTLDNVHPFNVDNDRRTVLAHNGILPRRPAKGDKRSDTRLLADSLAGMFGTLRKEAVRRKIEEWMGSYNKLVVLTVNPRMPARAFILNEKAGEWTADGIWYSNEGYRGYRWTYSGSGYGSAGAGWYKWSAEGYTEYHPAETTVIGKAGELADPDEGTATNAGRKWWEDLTTCRFCFAIMSNVETELGWCEACDTCQDCDQTTQNCQCYYRAPSKHDDKQLELWQGDRSPYALN